MRKLLLSGALAVFGLSAVAGGAHAAKAIKWSPTFRAAMTAAKTGNKLVMVDFYTEW